MMETIEENATSETYRGTGILPVEILEIRAHFHGQDVRATMVLNYKPVTFHGQDVRATMLLNPVTFQDSGWPFV
jgi:hypothetical protein